MTTTSLKLPDELKKRAAAAARRRGMTTHAFLLDAVQQVTTAAERRAQFIADGLRAREEFRRTGLAYDGKEVLAYFRAKVRGEKARRPRLKSWRG